MSRATLLLAFALAGCATFGHPPPEDVDVYAAVIRNLDAAYLSQGMTVSAWLSRYPAEDCRAPDQFPLIGLAMPHREVIDNLCANVARPSSLSSSQQRRLTVALSADSAPKAPRELRFSAIGYDASHQTALVYLEIGADLGFYVVLHRDRSTWQVVEQVLDWIS